MADSTIDDLTTLAGASTDTAADKVGIWDDSASTTKGQTIAELAIATGVAAHLADTSDAHDASAISADSTTLVGTGTDVQAVLEELDNGIADHLADTSAAHAASAISADSTTLVGTGTDVQAVLEELDNGIADHLADAAGAHAASAISFTPEGSIAATDVQAAIQEVRDEAAGAGALDGLSDVVITAAATGDILRFNGTNWVDYADSNYATASSVTDHTGDTSDAHDASAISVDSTTLVGTGTDVQAVLEELDNGIADHLADTTDAHDASAISFSATGTIAGTDVQTAVAEVASDAVQKAEFTAAGDVLIGTGSATYDNLAIGTAAGKAPTADPNATNKISIQFPMSIEEANRGTTGALASTYDRAHGETNDGPLATGRLNCYRIMLPKGLSVTNISFFSMTTAGASMTNQWFALFDSSKAKLAVTADDTSTAWAANTQKTLAVTGGPFVTTYTGWYWLGICVVGTTMPSLAAQTSTAGTSAKIKNPLPAGAFDSGLTNPASCPDPFGSAAAATGLAYAEVS